MSKIYESLVNTFEDEIEYYDHSNHKPCVVFDIDGTVIIDGIYAPQNKNEIIHDVHNFLLYIQNKGIEIFIITARPENKTNRYETSKMLTKLNIDYTHLYMWNRNTFNNPTTYKEECRKEIFQNNYNIIMSLGDNIWDYGDYGGVGVHIYNDGEKIKYIRDFL